MKPFIFNRYKHHLISMADRIRAIGATGDDELRRELTAPFLSIGKGVCDVYCGVLDVPAIFEEVDRYLETHGIDSPEALAAHLDAHGLVRRRGRYVELTLSDGSRFVLRAGDGEELFAHIHPSRAAPHTFRVRTPTLQTALLSQSAARVEGVPARDLSLVNRVRGDAGLPPVRELPVAVARLFDRIEAVS